MRKKKLPISKNKLIINNKNQPFASQGHMKITLPIC